MISAAQNALLGQAQHRETEVATYQANIESFILQLQIVAKPLRSDDWPEAIAEYRDPAVPVPPELDDDIEDEIAQYRHRDMLRARIRAERNQQRIAAVALEALKLQFGKGYQTALDAYRVRQGL